MPLCTKVPYATQWRAEVALRAIRQKGAALDKKMPTGTYWCRSCRCWHLTSKSESRTPG